MVGYYPLAEFGRFGTGNEHSRSHTELSPAEVSLANDILHGFPLGESCRHGLKLCLSGFGEFFHLAAQDVRHRQAEPHVEHPADDGFRLASLIEWSQSLPECFVRHIACKEIILVSGGSCPFSSL